MISQRVSVGLILACVGLMTGFLSVVCMKLDEEGKKPFYIKAIQWIAQILAETGILIMLLPC